MAVASVPGATVSTTLEVTEVEFVGNGATTNADAIFRNSSQQRLWRSDEFHNFEINLLRCGFGCDPCGSYVAMDAMMDVGPGIPNGLWDSGISASATT